MGLSLLAGAGRLIWPLLGTLVPIGNPQATKALLILLLAALAIGAPTGAVWLHMRGVNREAVSMADAACTLRISENARASAAQLSGLLTKIKEADTAADEPKTQAEEIAACRKSKLCRENAK